MTEMPLNYYELAASALQIIIIFMLLRSCFYLLRVWAEIPMLDMILLITVLITGIGLTSYNLTDPDYVLQRFPFNLMVLFGFAWAVYRMSKSKKDDLFTISNVIKRKYTPIEEYILTKISDDSDEGPEKVSQEDLLKFTIGRPYVRNKKYILVRLTPPQNSNILMKFNANMLAGSEFAEQYHPDMSEELYVDSGSVLDKSTGKIYGVGDVIVISAGTLHHIMAIETSEISAYLYKSE